MVTLKIFFVECDHSSVINLGKFQEVLGKFQEVLATILQKEPN